jgi:putative membrane protein
LAGISELITGVNELMTGINELITRINELITGINELVTGTNELITGINELVTGINELITGINELITGIYYGSSCRSNRSQRRSIREHVIIQRSGCYERAWRTEWNGGRRLLVIWIHMHSAWKAC